MQIVFDVKSHRYVIGNNEFTSVSKLLSKYFIFNIEKIAAIVAKRQNKTAREVILEWEQKTLLGKKIHNFLENEIYWNEGVVYNNVFHKLVKDLNEFQNTTFCVLSEQILYSTDSRIAGTSDLILKHDNQITIFDFKTGDLKKARGNEKVYIDFYLVPNTKITKYSLQVGFYRHMLKELLNIKENNIDTLLLSVNENTNINNLFDNVIKTEDYNYIVEYLLQKEAKKYVGQ